jgi:cell division septation protein DedD
VLAALLVFGSGLLIGYAVFTGVGKGVVKWPSALTFGSKTALPKKLAPPKNPILDKLRASLPKTAVAKGSAELKKLENRAKGFLKKKPAVPTPVPVTEAQIKALAPPAAIAPEALAAPPPPPEEYCLQLGAFTDLKKAKQLQDSLKEKGYTTSVFEGIDAGYKPWHAVRMSKFTDIDSATKAAADFTLKERIQAIVRPSGTL